MLLVKAVGCLLLRKFVSEPFSQHPLSILVLPNVTAPDTTVYTVVEFYCCISPTDTLLGFIS